MYTLLRCLVYNLKQTYCLIVKIKKALNDKNKKREDIIFLIEQLEIKFNNLHRDTELLFERFYPKDEEKLVFVLKYVPEYQQLKQLVVQSEKEKEHE